jgi:protein-disulfide isomerase
MSSADLSRKEKREEARAARRAAEEAERARADRRRRMFILSGVVALVVVVVAVVVAIAGSSSNTPPKPHSAAANAKAVAVTRELAGIQQSGATLGSPTAPVTVTEYGDLECPICQAFDVNSLPQLLTNDIRSGRVKMVYRSLQTATQDPTVFNTQQVAALAAGEQNLMWNYVDLFYHEQGQEGTGYVNEAYLAGLASQIPGLVSAQWLAARHSPALSQQVSSDQGQAAKLNFSSTPSFTVQGPKGGRGVSGSLPSYGQLESVIKSVS